MQGSGKVGVALLEHLDAALSFGIWVNARSQGSFYLMTGCIPSSGMGADFGPHVKSVTGVIHSLSPLLPISPQQLLPLGLS